MSNRSMYGTEDFEGQEVNGLRIGQMIARRPAPRYNAQCVRCGCEQTASQKDLSSGKARCQNSACGRDVERLRDELADTPRRFREREARKERERIDAAKHEFNQAAQRAAEAERQKILNVADDEWDLRKVDKDCAEITMTAAQALSFNREQYRLFEAETVGWYPTPANVDVMDSYLRRNGSDQIVSKAMLTAAFKRLDGFGLLAHRPAPAPEAPQPYVNLSIAPPAENAKPPEPGVYEGWDLATGEPRTYTKWQVDRMDSNQYRRAFRLYGDRAPRTPSHAAF